MTESEWQRQLEDLAAVYGWKWLHVRRSIGRRGGGPAWQTTTNVKGWPDLRDALCSEPEYADTAFFVDGLGGEPAKAVCARCLVREECRDYAITEGVGAGIWGGMTPQERKQWSKAA